VDDAVTSLVIVWLPVEEGYKAWTQEEADD